MTAATTVLSSWIAELQRSGSRNAERTARCAQELAATDPPSYAPSGNSLADATGLTVRWRDTACHCTDARGDDMSDELDGKTVGFLVAAEGTEQVELTEPWQAVEKAGGTPKLLSPETGSVQAFNHLDKADTFAVDEAVADADPSSYDALVLPGGVANPDL